MITIFLLFTDYVLQRFVIHLAFRISTLVASLLVCKKNCVCQLFELNPSLITTESLWECTNPIMNTCRTLLDRSLTLALENVCMVGMRHCKNNAIMKQVISFN